MSQIPSFERCSVIRHWILCTVHRCALNTNSRHICSRGGDGVCQTLLDSCFLACCQKEFLQRTLPKPDGRFRYSGIAVVPFFMAGRFFFSVVCEAGKLQRPKWQAWLTGTMEALWLYISLCTAHSSLNTRHMHRSTARTPWVFPWLNN